MPLLDREAAALCMAIYRYPDQPVPSWDFEDDGARDGLPWAAKVHEDGATDCVFAGTETDLEVFRDLDAIPVMVPGIGYVHSGFARGLDKVMQQLAALNPKRVRVTGHSYGAAHGRLVSRLLAVAGVIPAAPPVLFGEPASGFDFSPGRSYAVMGDFVPLLPVPVPGQEWTQGSPLIWLKQEPTADDAMRYHHIQLICAAMETIDATTP